MSSEKFALIEPWLEILWSKGGSDLLLIAGSVPRIRVDGQLVPVEDGAELSGAQIDQIVQPFLSEDQRVLFKEQLDVDFAFTWLDRARLRGSVFTQKGQTALALRLIPSRIPSFDDLGMPASAQWIAEQTRGFVLVTGPTGSGKSTTLASMIDRISASRAAHILTIEDPIEYVHHHQMSAVTQREIGQDSPSFERALRSALREDPDVLLVGEMRDIDSIQIALTMAETGHLVFGTLHTNDASQAVDRIIDVFPAARQEQTRVQLAASLTAIVAQRLVPKIGGGMVAAFEILIATNAVRNLIREGRSNQLQNVMMTNSREGMQTLESSLGALVQEGIVSYQEAYKVAAHPKELARMMNQSDAVIAKD
jgi:twitching motility protein PilT